MAREFPPNFYDEDGSIQCQLCLAPVGCPFEKIIEGFDDASRVMSDRSQPDNYMAARTVEGSEGALNRLTSADEALGDAEQRVRQALARRCLRYAAIEHNIPLPHED